VRLCQLGFGSGTFGEQGPLLIAQLSRPLVLLGLHGLVLLSAQVGDLVVEVLDGRRHRLAEDPHAAAGLIDEIDGLVGQLAVGDIAVGEIGGTHQGLIGEFGPVVAFVLLPQSVEDLNRLGDSRLVHVDRLEAALQG